MDIVITEWALQAYLDLKSQQAFTDQEYWAQIRPDVELLRAGIPSPHPKFALPNFWGAATDLSGNVVPGGFKMKWHNVGPGRVQLRVCVALIGGHAYLCRAYVKDSDATDKREVGKFKGYLQLIRQGRFIERGRL